MESGLIIGYLSPYRLHPSTYGKRAMLYGARESRSQNLIETLFRPIKRHCHVVANGYLKITAVAT